MNIDELLQNLPSREEIANAIGMGNRSSSYSVGNQDLLPALGIFGTGMLFGAGLALLFAPKSGQQVRKDISEKVQELGTQARDYIDETSGQTRQMASEAGESGRQMSAETPSSSQMGSAARSRNG